MAQTQSNSEPYFIQSPILAAASGSTGTIFVAPVAMVIQSINFLYSVISTSGTLQLTKDTGTTAPGGGSSVLVSGTALNVGSGGPVANTYTNAPLNATLATITLAAGDRLGWTLAGTLTGLAGCVAAITLQ